MDIWVQVRAAERRARQAQAVYPIPTRTLWLDDGGVHFAVRVVESLALKPASSSPQADPFLPYDPQMFVLDVPPRHVGLLNKFPVLDQHLLIVTREFEEQLAPLSGEDFRALAFCLQNAADEREGLVFYNGGPQAGASQRHKHLQMVPLPLADGEHPFPLEPLVQTTAINGLFQVAALSFEHSVVRFAGLTNEDWLQAHRAYVEMLQRHELWDGKASLTRPYNLLVTRHLMLLVPRSAECFEDISINALGFAGALLAKNIEQVERLKQAGLLNVLTAVACRQGEI